MLWKTKGVIDSTSLVVELTATASKMVLASEKSIFLAPGTLVTVHAARKRHKHCII